MSKHKIKPHKIIKKSREMIDRGEEAARLEVPKNISQQCATCYYWTGGTNCRAFPGGIPVVILKGKFDHKKPYPGDRGFRYKPA